MAEGTEINNVYDFTAYRMQKRAEDLLASGDPDASDALYNALEAYLQGLCDVQFIGGKTYITPKELDPAESKENNNV